MKYTLKQLFESKDDFDYLKSINAKSLSKGQRPPKGVSPKDFYKDLKTKVDKEAEQGPIFDQNVLSNVLEIETEVPQNVLQWIANQIKDGQDVDLSDSNLTRLLNYLSVEDTDLKTTSYTDVAGDLEHTVYDTDFKSFGKYSGKKVVYSFKDGWTVVEVGAQDASIEGNEMQHCAGEYCDSIERGEIGLYSLRDLQNNPHATIEVENGVAVQVKGKQNEYPDTKFHPYIDEFLYKNMMPNEEPLKFQTQEKEELDNNVEAQISLVKNRHANQELLVDLVHSPTLDPEVQKALAQSRFRDIRGMLAKNPVIIPEVQKTLADNIEWHVRRWLAVNPKLEPKLQKFLAKDSINHVRRRLASNVNLIPEVQNSLVNDRDENVQFKLSKNPSLTLELQHRFLTNEEPMFQITLAANPNLDLEIQKALASSPVRNVRAELIDTAELHPEVQLILTNDENVANRMALANIKTIEPKTLEALAVDSDQNVRSAVAVSSNIGNDVQSLLAADPESYVRMRLAKNRNLTPATQKVLANDLDEEVRLELAENPRITPAVIKQLLTDSSRQVRGTVKRNPRYLNYYKQQESRINRYSLKYLYEMNQSSSNSSS